MYTYIIRRISAVCTVYEIKHNGILLCRHLPTQYYYYAQFLFMLYTFYLPIRIQEKRTRLVTILSYCL